MNTIPTLAAFLALLWLAFYAFDALGNGLLGVAVLGAAFLYLVLTIIAIWDDVEVISGRGKR